MTYKLDIMKHRNKIFLITLIVMAVCIGALLIRGLNLGIDFESGTRLDFQVGSNVDLEKAKTALKELGYENLNGRVGGPNKEYLIFRFDRTMDKAEVDHITAKLSDTFGTNVGVQEQTVSPVVGREIARNAMISVLIACVGIIIYVAFRFEYRFGVAAILALAHDAIFTVGMFSLLQLEVDLVFIAAVLTIVGYSVNDTIVIFDRIRENMELMKPKKWEDLARLVNDSIHQTMTRSINTVVTVLFAALFLWILGGESISNFSLALLFGLVAGAYSSIFVASPVWAVWKWNSMQKKKERREQPEPVLE
ncbi:protein translocase subunit SecF [Staphylospora marina]|uniref:protein translocase subunit SecF n=1 Tax=Staphylospora marina TaxID=2490858 RepID=UPI001F153437|nr:protein translocase subunit SecF [Staphylospora marina]